MAFHYLSRNKVSTSDHNLTSLLGLGPKFYPYDDRVSFKNLEDILARLRRDARTRFFVANNNNENREDESHLLCGNNDNWEPKKAIGPVEGAINRFEKVLKTKFTSLRNTRSSNLTMV